MTCFRKIWLNIRYLLIPLAIYSNCESSYAQIVDNDHQQWVQYINLTRFHPKLILNTSASFRWKETFSISSLYHIRSGIEFQLNAYMRFTGGIGYYKPIDGSSSIHHEIRPFQGILINNDVGRARMLNRFQVEERMLNYIEANQQQPMYMRFRYALFFSIPLLDLSTSEARKDLALAVRNELFFNGPNDYQEKTLDLERVTVGPSFSMKHISLFVLWHNQISTLPEKGDYRYTSIIAFQLLHRLNL